MAFTLGNLREDLENVGSNVDGAPDLEVRQERERATAIEADLASESAHARAR
jgi:hypothetical protein